MTFDLTEARLHKRNMLAARQYAKDAAKVIVHRLTDPDADVAPLVAVAYSKAYAAALEIVAGDDDMDTVHDFLGFVAEAVDQVGELDAG